MFVSGTAHALLLTNILCSFPPYDTEYAAYRLEVIEISKKPEDVPDTADEADTHHVKEPEGMGWRVAVSIITFFGSIIAVILWLFFYAGNFNVYQNLAIVVVIFLVFIAVMGATWASWGMKQQDAWWKGERTKIF